MGNDPWNKYIHPGFTKINLEVPALLKFNMNNILDTIIYDGSTLPLKNDFVDTVLLIEVLEHVEYPDKLLKEIHRVLLPNGRLIMSVPFSARRHHIPFDYRRYTKEGLIKLLGANSFHIELLTERGNDLAVIFNKLLIYQISLIKKITFRKFLLNAILFLIISIFTISIYILIKVPMLNKTGNLTDPLGYFLVANKSS